ncbi:MAG: tRNA preQ1(34) S-adenosylmethionine ribosyltransferase-isomerase QueA [Casimicrobiaceae bacterium]|nr:tRNA preQ1(34) S-adenosylmethionine ribosyltransferase-isomerase QueA [Casimicrobiaceae bacterium]MCX8097913.1 tRNA preQ1(34) S-adenosylmethionine ribosyltransferase-isomerase QueA [Casimicrobiaceae bacterium]MDW8312737.1 tRNA preQ1(34) S-adenosylmethionine ribosyltransferase-isomerase QueA [Burkholderiales bacterium]
MANVSSTSLLPPFRLSDFDYELPEELIAREPLPERSAARLLDARSGRLEDRIFRELPEMLEAGDLLVFNDTRVLRARLFGRKATGGAVELLIERLLAPERALAQLRSSHPPAIGTRLRIADRAEVEVTARQDRFFELRLCDGAVDFEQLMQEAGELPLPPYLGRRAQASDEERYQTVYATTPGAVAAPTAGLHFDHQLLERCRAAGIEFAHVTLHVGAGTFLPVTSERIEEHRMHRERYVLPEETVAAIERCRARGRRVIAVGTTTVRTLEGVVAACGALQPHSGETELFITPGFPFRVVDGLITNFHLPRSTLLMLVAAFAGYEHMRRAYAHAVRARYRFFSYGDAMLLSRAESA